jgi:hypothetical protein
VSCPSNIDHDEGASILEKIKRISDALDNAAPNEEMSTDVGIIAPKPSLL